MGGAYNVGGVFIIALGFSVAFIAVFCFISWFFKLYLKIFFGGVGDHWDRWSGVQRIFFLLGLGFWIALIPLVIIYEVVAIACLIYLVVCIGKAIF